MPEHAVPVSKVEHRLNRDEIYSDVHFNKMPERQIYLTKKLNLVEMTESGVIILGVIFRSDLNIGIMIYEKDREIILKISPKGYLLNENNEVFGYLKDAVA